MSSLGRLIRVSGLCRSLLVILFFSVLVQAQDCSQSKPCATGCCSKFGYCGTGPDFCGAGNCVANCDFKLGCDANNPCKSGCCSKFGFCGLGPDYCSPQNCVAGCNSKAYCDPGGYGQYAEISTCPLNVCCSKWGFCGITSDFCGTKKVKRPSSANCPSHRLTKVVGYYEGWAKDRPCNKIVPELVPLGIYTHLNYAFATIDPRTYEVRPASPNDEELMIRLTDLKKQDPDLKVFIAIGGWTFNDPGPTATTFSDIAGSIAAQSAFIKSLMKFLGDYNFDGVDLDWEYPRAEDRSGRPADFVNFPNFIANLKTALRTNNGRDGLSITLPVSYWYLQHFDIKKLVKHVDFFNMMSYDLHGTWDANSKWLGNFLNSHTNLTEITEAMDLLWRNDIPPEKVVLGTAFYGRAFTASSASCTSPGCTFSSGARAGPCSGEVSVLLNSEIVDIARTRGITPVYDRNAAVKILTFDSNQWVTYDDADTLQQKANFARSQCMGGIMVWAVSHDTADGQFSQAIGRVAQRPAKALALALSSNNNAIKTYHNQCRWTGCGETCPAGWVRMMRDDKWRKSDPEPMRDNTACGSMDPPRELCCPGDTGPSSCGWYSHNNGRCKPGCPSDYVEVGSMSVACKSGSQTACCKKGADSLKLYEQCSWGCGSNFNCPNTEVAASFLGSGGQKCTVEEGNGSIITMQRDLLQKYCCSQSDTAKWADCDWYNVGFFESSRGGRNKFCPGGCPDGKVRVALDESPDKCPDGGRLARCCTPEYTTLTKRSDPQLAEWESALRYWVNDPTCPADAIFWKRDLEMGNTTHSSHGEPQSPWLAAMPMGHMGSGLTSHIDMVSPHPAGLQRRQTTTDKIIQYQLVYQIAERLFWGYGSTEDLRNLWSNTVEARFGGLSVNWLQAKVKRDITTLGWSPGYAITDALCRLQYFSDEVTRGSPTPAASCVCTRQDCCPENDRECQAGEEGLAKRAEAGWSLFDRVARVVKRAGASRYSFTNRAAGRGWTIRSRPYRSPSQLSANDPIRTFAYQVTTSNDCTITDPVRTNAVPGVHEAEHVVERQTPLLNFPRDAIDNIMPDGSTPGRTIRPITPAFMDFLNTNSLVNPPPARGNPQNNANYDNSRPMDRVANAVGSMENMDPFVMLQNYLNTLKSLLFRRGASLFSADTIRGFVNASSYTDGALAIRAALTMARYLRLGTVHGRTVNVLNDVRGELQLAETQFNAIPANANAQVDAALFWDYWIRAEYNRASQQMRTEIVSLANTLLARFRNDPVAVSTFNRQIVEAGTIDLVPQGLFMPPGGLP